MDLMETEILEIQQLLQIPLNFMKSWGHQLQTNYFTVDLVRGGGLLQAHSFYFVCSTFCLCKGKDLGRVPNKYNGGCYHFFLINESAFFPSRNIK